MGSGARRAILGCVCGLAAVVPPTSLGVSAASASTLSFSNHCCYDLRIDADALPNRLHLRTDNQRIVLHDATPGATISFRGPGSRCVGEGTATLDCARGSVVTPITVLIDLGPGDSFDTGDHGCAGGGGFALAGGSRASPGPDEVTVWGGSYPDQFSSFGRGVVHGCGGAGQLKATRGAASGGGGGALIRAKTGPRAAGGAGADPPDIPMAGAAPGGAG